MTFKGLIKYLLFRMVPLKKYMEITYWWYQKQRMDFDAPKKFSEKLFWLKLYYGVQKKELIQECYDKFTVRQYIASKVGEKYLPHLYALYDNAKDIDFTLLPNQYVLKVTQSCGYNIIQNGHSSIDEKAIKLQMEEWLSKTNDPKYIRRYEKEEAYYFNGKAKILCEEYIENERGQAPEDIRFYCFNGKAKFYSIDFNSVTEDGIKKKEYTRNVYDIDGSFIDVNFGRKNNLKEKEYHLKNFGEMVRIAEKLAEEFIFVRVDFYNLDGRIFVGELTFVPMGGAGRIEPIEYDYKWGDELQLPQKIDLNL